MNMNNLARHIVLRSTGPHRNLPHVFRGQQLRHIHETVTPEKPIFRWEVRIPPTTPVHLLLGRILNGELEHLLGPFGT
jgi:hypothetical protein